MLVNIFTIGIDKDIIKIYYIEIIKETYEGSVNI